jgi:uncharacterized membrane protein YuzA (DUF378 family)
MKAMDWIAAALVIVGALNWGLVGLFRFDLVQATFGATVLSSIVYSLVGIGGVYGLVRMVAGQRQLAPVRARGGALVLDA